LVKKRRRAWAASASTPNSQVHASFPGALSSNEAIEGLSIAVGTRANK
jgi:hypothetical protein